MKLCPLYFTCQFLPFYCKKISFLYDFTKFFISCLLSFTIIFLPVVRLMTVSGVSSTISIRLGLISTFCPFNFVISIILFPIVNTKECRKPLLPAFPPLCICFLSCVCYITADLPLSLQVGKLFQKSIGNGNDTAVCLETSLRGNHFRKFLGKIYITHFELSGRHFIAVCGNIHTDTVEFAGV